MIGVDVISVGNLKEPYLRDAVREYEKRLGAYCRIENLIFRQDAEIVPHLRERAYKIALCIEGQALTSEELAARIERLAVGGYSRIQFVIGASHGIPEEIKALCDLRLSFSKMTFPHQLMRVLLLEQLYRAFNLNSGGKYHK